MLPACLCLLYSLLFLPEPVSDALSIGITKSNSLLDNSYQSCYYLFCEYLLRIFVNIIQRKKK